MRLIGLERGLPRFSLLSIFFKKKFISLCPFIIVQTAKEGFVTIYEWIGYAAVGFSLLPFMAKTKEKMRFWGIVSLSIFMVGVWGQGGINGAFASLVSVSVKVLALAFDEKKLFFLKLLSPFIALVFYFFFNHEGLYGILPAIGLVLVIFADLQTDIVKMKIMYIVTLTPWLFYGIFMGSVSATLYEFVGIASLSVFLYRHGREGRCIGRTRR